MNRAAVCIGIDSYHAPNTLPGAVRSSRGMAVLLEQHGFHVEEVYNATATREQLIAAIQRMYALCPNQGDVMLLQYVAHGLPVAGQDCLVPVDVFPADGSTHLDRCIPRMQLNALLNQRPPHGHLLTNFDCCYSAGLNMAAREHIAGLPQVAHVEPKVLTDFEKNPLFAPLPIKFTEQVLTLSLNNLVQFSPCTASQLSVELPFGTQQNYYSLWTYHLLRLMQEPAAANYTYAQMFSAAKARAMAQYSSALPILAGDVALQGKKFLN